MSSHYLTIKDLTQAVGGKITPRMVRHYHDIGLLPQPQRSRGNYRLYGPEDVARLRRIVDLKEQGFQLAHILQILTQDIESLTPEILAQRLQQRYLAIMQQIARLRQTAQLLERFLGQDRSCQAAQIDLLAQIQALEGELLENHQVLDQLWHLIDEHAHFHPESFEESLEHLLPESGTRSEIEKELIKHLVLACGDVSIVHHLRLGWGAISAARLSLQMGRPIVTDVPAIAVALDRTRLAHLECPVQILIEDPHVATVVEAEQAFWQQSNSTDISLAIPSQSIVLVGFAPSVLMQICKAVKEELIAPALIIGLPIGFSHAPAAKRQLMGLDIPYITLEGALGGGLLAAVALNSLVASLLEKPNCHCYLSRT